MKKIFLMIFFLFILCLSSCKKYKYNGKKINEITYAHIDYLGAIVNERKIDFVNNQVLHRCYINNEEKPEYEVISTFSSIDVPKFMNAVGEVGFFKIKKEFKTKEEIIDGASWELYILYEDGTALESKGENASPYSLFQKVDTACYELFKDDLFFTLPNYS